MLSDPEYLSPLNKSDHCVLFFSFNYYSETNALPTVRLYYERGHYGQMTRDLNIDWITEFTGHEDDSCGRYLLLNLHILREETYLRSCFLVSLHGSIRASFRWIKSVSKEEKEKNRCFQGFLETRDGDREIRCTL